MLAWSQGRGPGSRALIHPSGPKGLGPDESPGRVYPPLPPLVPTAFPLGSTATATAGSIRPLMRGRGEDLAD